MQNLSRSNADRYVDNWFNLTESQRYYYKTLSDAEAEVFWQCYQFWGV